MTAPEPQIERRRKKPDVIVMVLFDGTNGRQVDEFTGGLVNFLPDGRIEVWNRQEKAWLRVPVGHRVTRGALGEYYPMSPQAYTDTTEPDDTEKGDEDGAGAGRDL